MNRTEKFADWEYKPNDHYGINAQDRGNHALGHGFFDFKKCYILLITTKRKGENNMKYVVICYAVHNKEIASYDSFDNEDAAYDFLQKDAQNTFEEEFENSRKEEQENIDFTISDDGSAYLSSCDGEYEWTWEVIEVR